MNVLSVLRLPNNDIVTAGGENNIKLWRNGQCVNTLKGHGGSVRSLALLPDVGFVSCANDGSVRVWTLTGDCIHQYVAHSNLIYFVGVLASGEIVTGSEDNTVKVWKDFACIDTITHPGCIWAVTQVSNGDIVTGCADSSARVFTRVADRVAPIGVQTSFQDAVKKSKKQIGGVDVTQLPPPEVLNTTVGKKDGEIKLVNKDGTAEAWSWSAKDKKWEKFGDVTEGDTVGVNNQLAGKEYLDGQLYDYVFNIELDEAKTEKLGYNLGDNPYDVAQKFIYKNMLSVRHLDVIANFIMKNTPQTISNVKPYSDPFTGTSRYIPPANTPMNPPKPNPNQEVAFSSYAKEQLAKKKETEERDKVKNTPQFPKPFEIIHAANYPGIQKKLLEFNTTLLLDENTTSFALVDTEILGLEEIVKIVNEQATNAKAFSVEHFKILDKMMKWPPKYLFPVIDLMRCIILCESAAQFYNQLFTGNQKNILAEILTACFANTNDVILQMMGTRFLSNMFYQAPAKQIIVKGANMVFSMTKGFENSKEERIRTAFAVLIHNYCVYYSTMHHTADPFTEYLLIFIKEFCSAATMPPPETMHILLSGLGTLIQQNKTLVQKAAMVGLNEVAALRRSHANHKLAAVSSQLYELFIKAQQQ